MPARLSKNVLSIVFSLLFVCQAAMAEVVTEIFPKKGSLDDLYTISYTIDGNQTNLLPDFSPLDKDFDIESTNSSTQISVLNGQMSAQMKWTVTLQPKTSGTFTLPAIRFGQDKSKPVTITIGEGRTGNKIPASNKNAFLENSVDNKTPYVQSEVLYRIKLYFAKRLSGADFAEPQAENALFMQLGEAKTHQTTIDGKRYFVLEQLYALFPEKSGPIKISPPVFKGIIERDQLTRIDQILMDVQKPIRLRGKTIELEVRAKPSNYPSKHWLPAKQLTLEEQIDSSAERIEKGAPITRTLKISALGLTASQLPNLSVKNGKNYKVYPEQGKGQNTIKDNSVLAQKTIKLVYLATEEGNLILPEITIPWWNVQTNKLETAKLPAKRFKIIASSNASNTEPNNEPEERSVPIETNKAPQASLTSLAPWGLVFLLVLSWLLFFLNKAFPIKAFLKRKTRWRKPRPQNPKSALKAACLRNDAKEAHDALLAYARVIEPNAHFDNVSALANFYQDLRLQQEINHLLEHLYARNDISWQGRPLWQLMKTLSKKKQTKGPKVTLPPLNP